MADGKSLVTVVRLLLYVLRTEQKESPELLVQMSNSPYDGLEKIRRIWRPELAEQVH